MYNILYSIQKIFKKRNIVYQLIFINTIIFILFSILKSIALISGLYFTDLFPPLDKFYLPNNTNKLLYQPWSFITYMFTHHNPFHLLFNMIWLHLLSNKILQYINKKELLNIYILGGISGGILFVLSNKLITYSNTYLLGSSASVLAIVIAIATYKPNDYITLPLIGSLKLKHLALICVLIDLTGITYTSNLGGNIAHLGGSIFGFLYIKLAEKKKNNLTFHKTRKRAKSDYEFNKERSIEQKEINKILEKISNSGYDSLTKKEKELLFNASKK